MKATPKPGSPGKVYFAAVGDVHDHFRLMDEKLSAWEARHNVALDFLLQVGDLQPCRNADDLATMATPQKYRALGDFEDLWRRQVSFDRPIYFIGGNHEPYGWLDQHPSGAELLPGLRYLGRVGQVHLHGLNVVGVTGIWSEEYFELPRPAVASIMNSKRKRYTYYNAADLEQARQDGRPDILMIHDWPAGLLDDTTDHPWKNRGSQGEAGIGSVPARALIDELRPRMVICGHMHWPFQTVLTHPDGTATQVHCLDRVRGASRSTSDIRFFQVNAGEDEIIEMPA